MRYYDKILWTLADNSVTLISKNELQSVIDALAVRAGILHAQYTQIKNKV